MNTVLILAHIAGRPCAFCASDVETIIELETIAPIPRAPPHVIGLTAQRSQALTVIDCRVIVGFKADDFLTDSRAAVVSVEGHSYALCVDQIRDVGTMISNPRDIAGGFGPSWSKFSNGMAETDTGPVLMLNTAKLIGSLVKTPLAD